MFDRGCLLDRAAIAHGSQTVEIHAPTHVSLVGASDIAIRIEQIDRSAPHAGRTVQGFPGEAFPQEARHPDVTPVRSPLNLRQQVFGGGARHRFCQHLQVHSLVLESKEDVAYFAKSVDYDAITANDYNLSVSAYVEAEDTREVIDIAQLNAELKTTVAKIDQLRTEIDTIVAEIGA